MSKVDESGGVFQVCNMHFPQGQLAWMIGLFLVNTEKSCIDFRCLCIIP